MKKKLISTHSQSFRKKRENGMNVSEIVSRYTVDTPARGFTYEALLNPQATVKYSKICTIIYSRSRHSYAAVRTAHDI